MRFLIVIFLIGFLACERTYESIVSPGGVEIKFLKKESREQLEYGNILFLSARYATSTGKILANATADNPMALYYDSMSATEGGLLQEVISLISVGDSVYFEIPAKNLWAVTFQQPIPDSIDVDEMIQFNLKITDQLSESEYQLYIKELDMRGNGDRYQQEEDELDAFLTRNNLQTDMTESGVRYIIHKTGAGAKPEPNDLVSVKYSGKLAGGKIFDEGVYEFRLGQREVIEGWDEGIALLTEGSVATLYVPSRLGYGSRGSSPQIPRFSTLIFEVELIKVKKN